PNLFQQFLRQWARAFTLGVFAASQERATAAGSQLHRRAAFRTGFFHVHLRDFFLWQRRRQDVLQLFAKLGGQRLVALTLRVRAARQEWPTRAALDDHRRLALLTRDAGFLRLDRVAFSIHIDRIAALGEGAARQERPAPALAKHHRRAALLPLVFCRLGPECRLVLGIEPHCRLAFRVAGTAQEWSTRPEALHHRLAAVGAGDVDLQLGHILFAFARLDVIAAGPFLVPARAADEFLLRLAGEALDQRLAALRAHLASLAAALLRHRLLGLLQRLREAAPELVQHVGVRQFVALDLIEFFLEVARELHVQDVGEMLDKQIGHGFAQFRGVEPAIHL